MTFEYDEITVTVHGSIYPLTWKVTRKQNRLKDQAGAAVVYDRDQQQEFIVINLTGTHSEHAAIRNFIISTVCFQQNTFSVIPDAGVDLGNGEGLEVTARYFSSNFSEIMNQYHSYTYQLILRVEG